MLPVISLTYAEGCLNNATALEVEAAALSRLTPIVDGRSWLLGLIAISKLPRPHRFGPGVMAFVRLPDWLPAWLTPRWIGMRITDADGCTTPLVVIVARIQQALATPGRR